MQQFMKLFNLSDTMHVIDIGGTKLHWALIPSKPKVTNVKISHEKNDNVRFKPMVDGATTLEMDENSIDISYSNSVIERVGDWDKHMDFPKEVRQIAPPYYVHTLYRWFFIEPYFITLFMRWFPKSIQKRLVPPFSLRYWISNNPRPSYNNQLMRLN